MTHIEVAICFVDQKLPPCHLGNRGFLGGKVSTSTTGRFARFRDFDEKDISGPAGVLSWSIPAHQLKRTLGTLGVTT